MTHKIHCPVTSGACTMNALTSRGVRYLLSRKFYEMRGQPGEHTRRLGLDREQNKNLLLNHIRRCGAAGAPLG